MAARKARGEVNVPPPSPGHSYRQIILGNIFSFINNVFYVLCLLLVLLGRLLDAILPLVMVLANAGVSVFQALPGEKQQAIDEVPFSSARKWSALVFDGNENDASGPSSAPPTHDPEGMTSDLPATRALRGVYVLGAPEMLRPHLLQGAHLNGR